MAKKTEVFENTDGRNSMLIGHIGKVCVLSAALVLGAAVAKAQPVD
jgi:hypothetical protein